MFNQAKSKANTRLRRLLIAATLASAALVSTAHAVTWDWNRLPTWTQDADQYASAAYPALSLAVDEYPASTYRSLGGTSLTQTFLSYWAPFANGGLCQQIAATIVASVAAQDGVARIDGCSANGNVGVVFVNRQGRSQSTLEVHGGSTFQVQPYARGARIGVYIPDNRVTFTITSLLPRPTIDLRLDLLLQLSVRPGDPLLGEPRVVVDECNATIPVGAMSSANSAVAVLAAFAQYNTSVQAAADGLSELSLAQTMAPICANVQSTLNTQLGGGGSPVKDYPSLSHVAWSPDLNSLFLLFSGAPKDVALTGPGVVSGSVWWDASQTSQFAGCAGVSVSVSVQAGAPTPPFGLFPRPAVGVLSSMSYRQVGSDSICDYTVANVPVNANLYVEATVVPNAFAAEVAAAPTLKGPIVIPGGRCEVMMRATGAGYRDDAPTICGSRASRANFQIAVAAAPR